MDRNRLIELAPHYVAMLVLAYLVIAAVRTAVGDPGFWAELVVIALVVFAYRPVVTRIGFGPSAWEEQ